MAKNYVCLLSVTLVYTVKYSNIIPVSFANWRCWRNCDRVTFINIQL